MISPEFLAELHPVLTPVKPSRKTPKLQRDGVSSPIPSPADVLSAMGSMSRHERVLIGSSLLLLQSGASEQPRPPQPLMAAGRVLPKPKATASMADGTATFRGAGRPGGRRSLPSTGTQALRISPSSELLGLHWKGAMTPDASHQASRAPQHRGKPAMLLGLTGESSDSLLPKPSTAKLETETLPAGRGRVIPRPITIAADPAPVAVVNGCANVRLAKLEVPLPMRSKSATPHRPFAASPIPHTSIISVNGDQLPPPSRGGTHMMFELKSIATPKPLQPAAQQHSRPPSRAASPIVTQPVQPQPVSPIAKLVPPQAEPTQAPSKEEQLPTLTVDCGPKVPTRPVLIGTKPLISPTISPMHTTTSDMCGWEDWDVHPSHVSRNLPPLSPRSPVDSPSDWLN